MASSDALSLEAGDVLAGKYRIEKILGRGGMGVVAAAVHTELGARVALKIMLPGVVGDVEAVERFAREGRSVSQLRGEHVVRVFDVGKLDDETPYLVMEHLEGEDFDELIQRAGPLAPVEAVDYILQACEGIAEAHAIGIVHRDLKPGNLFLTRRVDGSPLVKVVDFGLAKQQARRSLVSITAPLIAVGSPQYMSPEQMRANDVDATSDIWSLGICLYEFVVGVGPFEAEAVADIYARVIADAPQPPEQLNAGVPSGLSAVIMRCLEKNRARRYPDIGALAEALEAFGSPAMKGTAERILHVLHGPRRLPAGPALAAAVPTELLAIPAAPGAPKERRRSAVLFAVPIVALLAAGVLWSTRAARPVEALTTPSASAPASEPSQEPLPSIGIQAPRAAVPAGTALPPRGAAGTPGAAKRRAPSAPGIQRGFPAEPEPAAAPRPPASEAPVTPPAAPPRFVLASAHVEIGSATNTVGTTASNVNRAIAPLAGAMSSCYRGALVQAAGVIEGPGTLHIETDEEGVITGARATGPIAAAARCIGGTATGRKVANVDTGRASADIPLLFKGQ